MKNLKLLSAILFMAFFQILNSQSESMNDKDYNMFPEAQSGMKKAMIFLDKLENENNYKVEIIATKMAKVDNCNTHNLSGQFNVENLDGWGYNYYVFNTKGFIMSTRMACPGNTKEEREVFAGNTEFVRYNSRLPIVVYIPEDCMLKYKIWEPGEIQEAVAK